MRAYATELMHPAVAFALSQNSTERKGNAAKASKARERGKKITVQVGTVSGFFLCGAGEPKIRVVFNGKIQAFRYAKKKEESYGERRHNDTEEKHGRNETNSLAFRVNGSQNPAINAGRNTPNGDGRSATQIRPARFGSAVY